MAYPLRISALVATTVILCRTANAAPFQNFGFDRPLPEGFNLPGWTTSPQNGATSNQSQSFGGGMSLLDTIFPDSHFGLNAPAPVVRNFSLGIWPGLGVRPFTLAQTGDIPAEAQSLQFLYQGADLRVYVGDALEPVNFIGTRPTDNPAAPTAPYFAVDVSPFAGKTAELRFEFRSPGYDDFSGAPFIIGTPFAKSHVLDHLKLSALPASVPEPGTYGPVRPRLRRPSRPLPPPTPVAAEVTRRKRYAPQKQKPAGLRHAGWVNPDPRGYTLPPPMESRNMMLFGVFLSLPSSRSIASTGGTPVSARRSTVMRLYSSGW